MCKNRFSLVSFRKMKNIPSQTKIWSLQHFYHQEHSPTNNYVHRKVLWRHTQYKLHASIYGRFWPGGRLTEVAHKFRAFSETQLLRRFWWCALVWSAKHSRPANHKWMWRVAKDRNTTRRDLEREILWKMGSSRDFVLQHIIYPRTNVS